MDPTYATSRTKALQVKLSGLAAGSQTRFLALHPFGVEVDSTASTACYSNFSNPAVCNPASRSYANPQPGVWEILVESLARRRCWRTRTGEGTVTANQAVSEGRSMFGAMNVTSDSGALLGTGTVTIKSVTE